MAGLVHPQSPQGKHYRRRKQFFLPGFRTQEHPAPRKHVRDFAHLFVGQDI